MKVAVLLAGIADPKWPLDGKHPRILSPFDESALEVALKLRDARPETTITVLLAGGIEDDGLARAVAAFRPDRLLRVSLPEAVAWDLHAQARLWQSILGGEEQLVLVGREFGDRDDGAFPAVLAGTLAATFTGLAQEVRADAAGVKVMRERGIMEELIDAPLPLVASITNDRRNRLRHPLMKNVMLAKKAAIEAVMPQDAAAPRVALESLAPPAAVPRAARCRMLEGTAAERAQALADFLGPWLAST